MAERKQTDEIKHRGHREGTFEKLPSGLIACKIRFVDKRTGKNRTVKRTGKSNGDAKKNALSAIKDIEEGNELRNKSRQTIYEFLSEWLENYHRPNISRGSYLRYESALRVYIKPRMSDILLKEVCTDDIQSLYTALAESGKTRTKEPGKSEGLTSYSIRSAHNMLRKAFNHALQQGKIMKNPMDGAKAPRVQRKGINPLTVDQARRVLKQAKTERLYVAFLLDFATGLRKGELLALRWKDIDLKKGTATVGRQLPRFEKGQDGVRVPKFGELKTTASKRTVPIPTDVLGELKQHKSRQAEEKMAARIKAAEHEKNHGVKVAITAYYKDMDLVFCMENGEAVEPTYMNKLFNKYLKSANLPNFRFHDIRHTFATLALGRGEPIKKVSAIMGHSNIQITLETYVHLDPKMLETSVLVDVFTQEPEPQKPVGDIISMGHSVGHEQ